jgi:hypothetical protein
MKRLLTSMMLSCVLCVSAFGGDIPSLGTPQPEPGAPSQTTSNAPGDIPSGGEPGEVPSVDPDAMVSAVLAVLGIFAV